MGNAGLTFIQPWKFVKELWRPSEDLRGEERKYIEFFFFKISDQKLDFTLALSYLNPALNNLAQ